MPPPQEIVSFALIAHYYSIFFVNLLPYPQVTVDHYALKDAVFDRLAPKIFGTPLYFASCIP